MVALSGAPLTRATRAAKSGHLVVNDDLFPAVTTI